MSYRLWLDIRWPSQLFSESAGWKQLFEIINAVADIGLDSPQGCQSCHYAVTVTPDLHSFFWLNFPSWSWQEALWSHCSPLKHLSSPAQKYLFLSGISETDPTKLENLVSKLFFHIYFWYIYIQVTLFVRLWWTTLSFLIASGWHPSLTQYLIINTYLYFSSHSKMTDYAGWEREGRTGCFAVLKNVLFPVLLIFRTLHSTPLRCVSATTGEMPGCVLRLKSAYQWCRVGQSDDRQSSQPGASGGGEGRFRTCACIKPILGIIIN